jgi:hypothetical protein
MSGNELQRVGVVDMSKTPFSNKCDILGSLWLNYREDAATNETWQAFFDYNDVALPMAYCLSEGLVDLNKNNDADSLIEETWTIFCQYIDIDPEEEYENIADAFGASLNPPLETATSE